METGLIIEEQRRFFDNTLDEVEGRFQEQQYYRKARATAASKGYGLRTALRILRVETDFAVAKLTTSRMAQKGSR